MLKETLNIKTSDNQSVEIRKPKPFRNTLLGTVTGLSLSGIALLTNPAHTEANDIPQQSNSRLITPKQEEILIDALSIGALATAGAIGVFMYRNRKKFFTNENKSNK